MNDQNENEDRARCEALLAGLELAAIGSAEVNRAIVEGRYREFTEVQRKTLCEAVPKKVQALLADGVSPDRARAAVREYARVAVRVVLGTPSHLN